ncbi:MAG: hypothetical protein IJO88_03630 [Oscillospiraceae bacterium]|nr:hypothetical protein [Oscillospiraceae bacterium]
MESIMDWIYKNYFSWPCEENLHDRLLEIRKKQAQEQYGAVLQKIKKIDEDIYQENCVMVSHIIIDDRDLNDTIGSVQKNRPWDR